MATETSALAERLRKKLGIDVTAPEAAMRRSPAFSRAKEASEGIMEKLGFADPAVSREGIPDFSFRYALGRADTPAERSSVMDKRVGKGLWGVDEYGRYVVSPQGAFKFGIRTDKPITVEDFESLTLGDVADVLPDVPAIGGSMAGAVAGGAAGAAAGPLAPAAIPLGAIAGAALGGMGGRGFQEAGESLMGENVQTAGEVAGDLAGEGVAAATGEAVFRPLGFLGRRALAPRAHKMTDEARRMIAASKEIGVRPRATAVTGGGGLLPRFEALAINVLGDTVAEKNSRALLAELDNLRTAAGPSAGREATGTGVEAAVSRARQALSRWGTRYYDNGVDKMAGGAPVVPTQEIKATLARVMEALPATKEGKPFPIDDTIRQLYSYLEELPEQITIPQARALRDALWARVDDGTLTPSMGSHRASDLANSVTRSFDQVDGEVGQALRTVNAQYKAHRSKFEDAFLDRITKSPRLAGRVPNERLVDSMFRPRNAASIRKVMMILPEGKRREVRRQAMEDLLDEVSGFTSGSVERVWRGPQFRNTISRYGQETLDAMFGKDLAKRLDQFATAVHTSTLKPKSMSGGIVAANIALHPLQNLGRLARLKVMSDFLASDKGLQWATEGFKAPNTRKSMAALTRMQIQLATLAEQYARDRPQTDDEPTP